MKPVEPFEVSHINIRETGSMYNGGCAKGKTNDEKKKKTHCARALCKRRLLAKSVLKFFLASVGTISSSLHCYPAEREGIELCRFEKGVQGETHTCLSGNPTGRRQECRYPDCG